MADVPAAPARAKAAADYLLGERDAAGQLRDGVEVRRDDPHTVAVLEFEHNYTTGVVTSAPEDRPTETVLDKFEQTSLDRS